MEALGDGALPSSASILPFPSSYSFLLTAQPVALTFLEHAMLFHASMPLHMLSPDSGTPFPVGPLGTHPLRLSSTALTPPLDRTPAHPRGFVPAA